MLEDLQNSVEITYRDFEKNPTLDNLQQYRICVVQLNNLLDILVEEHPDS